MSFSLAIEILLSLLLVATLGYCALLERRLSALRSGQDGLKDTIGQMNKAIANAESSMRLLKAAAASASETLDERLSRARALADELSLLAVSGERIADRIDRAAPKSASILPASLVNRLESLAPQALRTVR
jgi:phage shock protein A